MSASTFMTILGINLASTLPMAAASDNDTQVDRIKLTLVGQLAGLDAASIQVAGHYTYVSDYTGCVSIIDISNPANPQRVGAVTNSGVSLEAVSGEYAYLADRFQSPTGSSSSG